MSTVGKNGSLEIDWTSYDGEREESDKRTVKGCEVEGLWQEQSSCSSLSDGVYIEMVSSRDRKKAIRYKDPYPNSYLCIGTVPSNAVCNMRAPCGSHPARNHGSNSF